MLPQRGEAVQNGGMGESINCRRRWRGAWRLVLALCGSSMCLLQAWAHDVVVVSSDAGAGYVETSNAWRAAVQRLGVTPADILYVNARDADGLNLAAKPVPRVVVTLGSEALRVVLQKDSAMPVLAGLIPRNGLERLLRETPRRGTGPLTALYLDQPLGRQLDALRQVFPNAKRVGVLLGPESSAQQSALTAAAQARGLALSTGTIDGSARLPVALRSALDDADVLFALADPQVYNSVTLANILLTAYRARIPVVAFSPAYVRAGALMSVHSTPEQVGNQLGQWTRTVLHGGAVAAGGQYPVDFSIAVNDNVARSLGLDLDVAKLETAVRQAERKS